ncbi:MAG: hypothetical protein KF794_02040 [Xanthobacteraceae bacterium]|nr:hypothetical protein [Xanthobacteraceae bacterium]QYK45512.1 MAG: hypothetical protein KF794_02040 [Xanthobacteraceae bacterium]
MAERRFWLILPAFAVAFGLLGAIPAKAQLSVPPTTQDEDEDEPSFFAKALGAAGIIQLPGSGNEINYQERPPLVLPPTVNSLAPNQVLAPAPQNFQADPWNFNAPNQSLTPDYAPPPAANLQLPPPVEPGSVRLRNPDFPVNPEDRIAERKKKKKKGTPRTDPFYSGRQLSPQELSQTAPVAATGNPKSVDHDRSPGILTRLSPSELGFKGWGNKDKEQPRAVFTGEPDRQSLTQPPPGYQTPSANAPYGSVSEEKQKASQKRDPYAPRGPTLPGER